MRHQLHYEPIGLNLSPEKFTLPELQTLYETILGKKLGQRHFTKKLVSLDIIWKLNERNTLEGKSYFFNSKITISGKANQPVFLRCNSFLISASSLPVCPLTLLFSCARRIRYGITSFRGPKGKYLLTEKPALARLNEI